MEVVQLEQVFQVVANGMGHGVVTLDAVVRSQGERPLTRVRYRRAVAGARRRQESKRDRQTRCRTCSQTLNRRHAFQM